MMLIDPKQLETQINKCNDIDEVKYILNELFVNTYEIKSKDVVLATSRLIEKLVLDKQDECTENLLKAFYPQCTNILKRMEVL